MLSERPGDARRITARGGCQTLRQAPLAVFFFQGDRQKGETVVGFFGSHLAVILPCRDRPPCGGVAEWRYGGIMTHRMAHNGTTWQEEEAEPRKQGVPRR